MMLKNLQTIIDCEQVSTETDTETLQNALVLIDYQLAEIQEHNWGVIGKAAVARLLRVKDIVLGLLNARHGLDGMTLVQHGP